MRKQILVAVSLAVVAAGAGGGLYLRRAATDDPTLHDTLEAAALGYVAWTPVAEEDRDKRGVVRHDAERAWPGINVFCVEGRPGGLLMDMAGEIVRQIPDRRAEPEDCRLLEPTADGGFLMMTKAGSVLLLDAEGRIRWQGNRSYHHDAVVAPDGDIVALAERTGYWPAINPFKGVRDNLLLRVDRTAGVEWEVSFAAMTGADPALRRLSKERRLTYPLHLVDNAFNANTVEILDRDVEKGGRILFRRGWVLICWRNLDIVGVIDPARREMVWSWGAGELEHPHHPSLLPGGNLLIFDNGKYRGWSRVLELDPGSGKIVWEYRGDPVESFYSQSRGAAQRLPNGNTLITESERGRVFEVTPAGEIVWDFFEASLRQGMLSEGLERATIYRMMRMPLAARAG